MSLYGSCQLLHSFESFVHGLMYGLSRGAAARGARRALALAAVGVALALAVGGVAALDDVDFQVERIEGDGWRAFDVDASIALTADATIAKLHVARLELTASHQALRDVQLECRKLDISPDAFACERALVRVAKPGSAQTIEASVRYGRRTGSLDVDIAKLPLKVGAASATIALREDAWTVSFALADASLPELFALAGTLAAPIPPLTIAAGRASVTGRVSGQGGEIQEALLEGRIAGLTVNNESGSIASDALAFDVHTSLRRERAGSRFAVELRSRSGQAYAQPIFLDLGVRGAALTATGTVQARRITIDRFSLDHVGVAKIAGAAAVDLDEQSPLRRLDARIESISFPGAYESYLQPLLLDTNFKALQTAGSLSGRITVDAGAPRSIELAFHDIAFEDAAARFGLSGLTGQWRWRDAPDRDESQDAMHPAPASTLRWRGGVLLGLSLGPTELNFHSEGRQFRLLEGTRVPLLDGAVELETLRARNIGTPKVAFLVDATIQPISVDQLCRAFGWPAFGGRVAGVISKLRMREGVVTMGATLQAQVFDGAVRVSDLRLEEPFGQWPRLYSSIAFERLDLELVTRAFSFGRITGRLSGEVRDLELFNWSPVAFDARFFTPPGDRSRRRISQRAVENIGSIGGGGAGVSAALSSGFLRFFDDFNYDRLGLSCRLENDVCHMSGVAPAPNGGYYLVKGKGLPRIDVIGNSKRVDWPRLVQQLIAITESEGPVVR